MFDKFDYFNRGYIFGVKTDKYKPYINYDWSATTTSGLRYLKDVGSTPTYNASMYFGRGAYLNGVDQRITVPINTTIQTALKRVNGIVTINEISQTLTNYVISGLGVHKDYYLFTRLLTTAEKDSYTNTPELFYAMAQADSTCVLNMPMCETDGYVRNMKSYGEGSELDTSFVAYNYISSNLLRLSQFNLGLVIEANKTYLVEIGYDDTANSILTGYVCYGEKGNGTHAEFQTVLKGIVNGTKGTAFYLLQIPSTYLRLSSTTAYAWISTTAADKTAYISVRSLKEVTGVYPITNYTTSVRDNAKNLQYGLQTCKFVRDSLGVIQSASNYLECDGVGYADTGLMLDASVLGKSFSFETIDKVTKTLYEGDGIYNVCGWQSEQFKWLGNTAAKSISLGVFNHRVAIYNAENNTLQVFVNKVGGNIINCTLSTTLSASYPIGGIFFGGSILEVRSRLNPYRIFKVHNKVLTQEEITKNYNEYVAKGLLS